MANFVKTCSNNLNIFGPARPNYWGVMLWGDKWAYGNNDSAISVTKVISNSLSLADQINLSVGFIRTFVSTLNVSADMSDERLFDAAGYQYVFGGTGNLETRPLTSYNEVSNPAASFTTVSNTSTSWVRQ